MILVRILLAVLHLLTNALAGGGVLAAALLPLPEEDRRRLTRLSLIALALGLATGLGHIGLLWLGAAPGYPAAAARVPAFAYGMLGAEWLFTFTLYGIYLATWRRLGRRRLVHGLIGVVGATNLLYHFPTMMILLGELAATPSLSDATVIDRPAVRGLIVTARPALLLLHYWSLCALAPGVVLLAWPAAGGRRPVVANLLCLLATVALVLTGAALLAATGAKAAPLVTLSAPAGWLLAAGVVCGLVLLLHLSLGAAYGGRHSRAPLALGAAAATLMTTAAIVAH